jgi:hypothetical protein
MLPTLHSIKLLRKASTLQTELLLELRVVQVKCVGKYASLVVRVLASLSIYVHIHDLHPIEPSCSPVTSKLPRHIIVLCLTNIVTVEPQEHLFGDGRPLEKRYVTLADCTIKQEISPDQRHSSATPNQLLPLRMTANSKSGETHLLGPAAMHLILLYPLIKLLLVLARAEEDATALEDFLVATAVRRSTIAYLKRSRYHSQHSR